MLVLINNHGLYPKPSPLMENFAPDIYKGYKFIVEGNSDKKDWFVEQCQYLSNVDKNGTKKKKGAPNFVTISGFITTTHLGQKEFNTKAYQQSILHWFLLNYSEYLERGPLKNTLKNPVFKIGNICAKPSAIEGFLDNMSGKTSAGTALVTSAGDLVFIDDDERLLSIPAFGAMLFRYSSNGNNQSDFQKLVQMGQRWHQRNQNRVMMKLQSSRIATTLNNANIIDTTLNNANAVDSDDGVDYGPTDLHDNEEEGDDNDADDNNYIPTPKKRGEEPFHQKNRNKPSPQIKRNSFNCVFRCTNFITISSRGKIKTWFVHLEN